EPEPVVAAAPAQEPEPEPVVAAAPAPEPELEPVVAAAPEPEPEPEPVVAAAPTPEPEPLVAAARASEPEPAPAAEPQPALAAPRRISVPPPAKPVIAPRPIVTKPLAMPQPVMSTPAPHEEHSYEFAAAPQAPEPAPHAVVGSAAAPEFAAPPVVTPEPSAAAASLRQSTASPELESASPRPVPPPEPATVLPMSRNPIRAEQSASFVGDPTMDGLQRLLRISAARGASTLYLSSDARPSIRVDGELQSLDSEPVLTARDIESLLLTLMPERSHEALRTGAPSEWMCDIEDVGRVRCTTFRDHVGPGGVFRLMPTRTVSAEQVGLPKSVQALASEPEGLILIAGPRSSGKRTLMSAFVDLINRTRRDHVITIEREINIVHPRGSSFISQREIRGSDDDLLAASRAALREDPDVLVIEDLRTGALMNVALEAAASGRLVIGGFSAQTATAAIDRIIELYAPDQRQQVQFAIADTLRAVVAQVLLRKVGGGRVAAREVLLNTAAVSSVIAEGKTSQLPMAIEGGRRHGMMPLSDTLVSLVQGGVVTTREAYRHASDRVGLLAALKRHGIDVSELSTLNAHTG
ncbi:MAG TPA: ATPase, T2SS/T4P/T4SS family, partial [Vicinamibacterales bacterium]|nr:ATPase, T2SS/T4P/T4SS family [Vicinamibacterales bacterium]